MASKWGSELLINTITANDQSEPAITALADGRFVVAWSDGSETGIRADLCGSSAAGVSPPTVWKRERSNRHDTTAERR